MFRVCHAFLSVHCSLVVTCWERADLLALLYVMFYCVFVTVLCGVLGQVWCLIVSIPYLCLLSYFYFSDNTNIEICCNRYWCLRSSGRYIFSIDLHSASFVYIPNARLDVFNMFALYVKMCSCKRKQETVSKYRKQNKNP